MDGDVKQRAGGAIPAYTDTFRARNTRAQRDTLRKLGKEFGFDPDHPPVDPRRLEIIDEPAYGMMRKIGDCVDRSSQRAGVELSGEKREELIAVGRDFARSVGTLYQIRSFVENAARQAHNAGEKKRLEAAGEVGLRLWDDHVEEGRRKEEKVRHAQEMENVYAYHVLEDALVRMRSFLREDGDDKERSRVKDRAAISLLGGVIRELINNCNFPVTLVEPYRPPRGANIEGWNEDVMGRFLERMRNNLNNEHRSKTGRT